MIFSVFPLCLLLSVLCSVCSLFSALRPLPSLLPSALCPLLSALCSLPSTLCPLPSSLCPLPSPVCRVPCAVCPLPSALSPLLSHADPSRFPVCHSRAGDGLGADRGASNRPDLPTRRPGVVQTSISGHRLLLLPADRCPMFGQPHAWTKLAAGAPLPSFSSLGARLPLDNVLACAAVAGCSA